MAKATKTGTPSAAQAKANKQAIDPAALMEQFINTLAHVRTASLLVDDLPPNTTAIGYRPAAAARPSGYSRAAATTGAATRPLPSPLRSLLVQIAHARRRGSPRPPEVAANRVAIPDAADDAGWIARRQTISGDVRRNNTTGTNRGVMADADARQDAHARANPYVIFDNNRLGGRQHAMLH